MSESLKKLKIFAMRKKLFNEVYGDERLLIEMNFAVVAVVVVAFVEIDLFFLVAFYFC